MIIVWLSIVIVNHMLLLMLSISCLKTMLAIYQFQQYKKNYYTIYAYIVVTVLDCTKAFDLCKFSILFRRMLDSGVPPIVVRCLMFMYQEQKGGVKLGLSSSA